MSYMKKIILLNIATLFLVFAMQMNVLAAKVMVEYQGQVTISAHKMHVVVTDVKADGTEYTVSSGTVYTHVKVNEQPGAMYRGDSFITDAESPANLVATLKDGKIYDMYAAQRDTQINKQTEK